MNQDMSPSVKSIVVLLNNISELIVQSNKRTEARDVMKAIVIYAGSKSIKLPEDKVSSFFGRLLDARPYTLSSLVMDIAKDLLVKDMEIRKESAKRDRLNSIKKKKNDKEDKEDKNEKDDKEKEKKTPEPGEMEE
jgi:hypothetical protein